MNIAILLMAGSSLRFDQEKKKQFYEIKGIPSFLYPLQALENSEHIDEIHLVANTMDENPIQKILKNYKFSKLKSIIKGGISRQDSVYNALRYINIIHPNCENVLIHDAARILLTTKIINNIFNAAKTHNFVVCATHENDSIASVTQNYIVKYQSRRTVHKILTPQCFNFRKLFEVYEKAFMDNYKGSNDDAAILIKYGEKVRIVIEDDSLIKLTYYNDLKIINHLIDGGVLNDNDFNLLKPKGK